MRWFRFYTETLDKAKVQKLPAKLFRLWVNLLCVSSEHSGQLPDVQTLSFRIRIPSTELSADLERLFDANLIDVDNEGVMRMHDWGEWQRNNDSSAERVRRFREKQKRGTKPPVTVTVTRSDTDTDTDTEQNPLNPPSADAEAVQAFTLKSPPTNGTAKPARNGSVTAAEKSAWFHAEFWPVVWAKIGGKQAALAEWLRVVHTRAEAEKIIAAAIDQGPGILAKANYMAAQSGEDEIHPLHPRTWLHKGTYEDEKMPKPSMAAARKKSEIDLYFESGQA